MYKLLIVDDEPLVQIGVRSMIDYQQLDIVVTGIADNGKTAIKMIREQQPQIVILDIKIPILDGLEVIEEVNKSSDDPPQFILLTNYDDFSLLRRAMRMGAFDYLIKIELNQDILIQTLQRVIKQIKINHIEDSVPGSNVKKIKSNQTALVDKFFLKLLNNLFESMDEISQSMNELRCDFSANFYTVLYLQTVHANEKKKVSDKEDYPIQYVYNLITSICKRDFRYYLVPWNFNAFVLIIGLDETPDWNKENDPVYLCIKNIQNMIHRYLSIHVSVGVGSIVNKISNISDSFRESAIACLHCNHEKTMAIYEKLNTDMTNQFDASISNCKEELRQAFIEFNSGKVETVFAEIIDLISNQNPKVEIAIDICSNLLHFIRATLNNSEEVLSDIFLQRFDSFYALYKLRTIQQIVLWLEQLKEGLCTNISKQDSEKNNWLLPSIKKYVSSHCYEKLQLADVANVFGVSPGYISAIFSKYNNMGYSDYVTLVKITKAKQLLTEDKLMIYEVSEMLGYNDPYYFSRVFKKIVGCSPKEYVLRSKQ